MRLRLLIASVAAPLALWAALPLATEGAPPRSKLDDIQRKIASARGQIARRKGSERVLSSQIAAYSQRIAVLQRRIEGLQHRQSVIETDLARKQAQLDRLQSALRAERARLVRLRARLIEARAALAGRLRELYEADAPDIVTVILSARGFADLLERGEFLERVSAQDQKVIGIVRRARADAIATERRLDRLERRQRLITQAVAARRDEIVSVKQGVIDARAGLDRARAGKRGTLARVRGQRHELEEDLGALEREQARVRAALQRAATGFAAVAGGGSGAMIWPVSGPITGSFGEARPGHMHAGLDIAAPTGTPIRAARAGRVVLAAWTGGYGNYTCIQHTASLATCYAHQSSYGTSVGAAVAQGQVIGYVGNTGHSFGSHLHFEVRVGGAPVSPLAYL